MDSVDGPPADVPHAYTATSPGPVTARVVREGGSSCLRPGPRGAGEGLIPFGERSAVALPACSCRSATASG